MTSDAFESKQELFFKLEDFEGPLDLLLHLIKKNEMDIYDISMVTITSQYLEYIERLKELQLDIAGEYLVTAAMLINIKSRMLLPNEKPLYDDEDKEDPREALVQQLLLHQTFQKAAENMKDYADERKKLYQREQAMIPADAKLGKLDPANGQLDTLQQAFARLMLKKKVQRPVMRRIEGEHYFLDEQITRVKELVTTAKEPILFDELFPQDAEVELVVTTFLALLELTKRGTVKVSQSKNLGPIQLVSGEQK